MCLRVCLSVCLGVSLGARPPRQLRRLTLRPERVIFYPMKEETIVRSRRIDSGHPLILDHPPHEGIVVYAVYTAACNNPECPCGRMHLYIYPGVENADGKVQIQRPALEGECSPDGSDLEIDPGESEHAREDMVEWLKGELAKEEPRAWISERWRRMRGQIGDPAYPAPLPPEDLEWLTPFRDVFPYEFDLIVTVSEVLYLAEDQYCLRSGCDCDEAVVALIDVEKSRQVGSVRVPVHRLHAAKFEGDPEVEGIWSAFVAQHEQTVLRDRLLQIRSAMPTPDLAPVKLRGSKVGRNAPCPCGSGQKFKKCCAKVGGPAD